MNKEFQIWLKESWIKHGGLLSLAVTADLFDIDPSTVTNWIKTGKVSTIKYEKRKFISFSEVIKIIETRESKNEKKTKTVTLEDAQTKEKTSLAKMHLSDSIK